MPTWHTSMLPTLTTQTGIGLALACIILLYAETGADTLLRATAGCSIMQHLSARASKSGCAAWCKGVGASATTNTAGCTSTPIKCTAPLLHHTDDSWSDPNVCGDCAMGSLQDYQPRSSCTSTLVASVQQCEDISKPASACGITENPKQSFSPAVRTSPSNIGNPTDAGVGSISHTHHAGPCWCACKVVAAKVLSAPAQVWLVLVAYAVACGTMLKAVKHTVMAYKWSTPLVTHHQGRNDDQQETAVPIIQPSTVPSKTIHDSAESLSPVPILTLNADRVMQQIRQKRASITRSSAGGAAVDSDVLYQSKIGLQTRLISVKVSDRVSSCSDSLQKLIMLITMCMLVYGVAGSCLLSQASTACQHVSLYGCVVLLSSEVSCFC